MLNNITPQLSKSGKIYLPLTPSQQETFNIMCDICYKEDFYITREIILEEHRMRNIILSYGGLLGRIKGIIRKGYAEYYHGKILPTLKGVRKYLPYNTNEEYYRFIKKNILTFKKRVRIANHITT